MAIPTDPRHIYSGLTRRLGAVPPVVHKAMMLNFYAIANQVGLDNLYPRLLVVMDTNQTLSYAIAQARGKSHPMDELLEDQYACIVSSPMLETEFTRNASGVATAKKLPASALLEVWQSRIRPRVDLLSGASQRAWAEADRVIGPIHRNDVPFMAVFLDLSADVVVSWDHSFKATLGSFAWTPAQAKWASIRIREGVIALYALHPLGTSAARAIALILWTIMASLIKMACEAWKALKDAVSDVVKSAEKLPGWMQLGLLALGYSYATRNADKITQWFDRTKETIRRWARWASDKLGAFVTWLRRWTNILAELIGLLVEAVLVAANELAGVRYGVKPRLDIASGNPSRWLITGR